MENTYKEGHFYWVIVSGKWVPAEYCDGDFWPAGFIDGHTGQALVAHVDDDCIGDEIIHIENSHVT